MILSVRLLDFTRSSTFDDQFKYELLLLDIIESQNYLKKSLGPNNLEVT